jgi:hypothetical protein
MYKQQYFMLRLFYKVLRVHHDGFGYCSGVECELEEKVDYYVKDIEVPEKLKQCSINCKIPISSVPHEYHFYEEQDLYGGSYYCIFYECQYPARELKPHTINYELCEAAIISKKQPLAIVHFPIPLDEIPLNSIPPINPTPNTVNNTAEYSSDGDKTPELVHLETPLANKVREYLASHKKW